MAQPVNSEALDTAVHIIQVALAPVFLLSGVATLLNVFSTRFARVADQVDALNKVIEGADADKLPLLLHRLGRLRRRSIVLDIAVVLAAGGGAFTCATVLALFVGEAGGPALATSLFVTFGLAIACTLAAIAAFSVEMTMASRHVRREAAAGKDYVEPG
ncbi:MAG TPA: DUF2721 domain-containing protein [Stellaceae bacterium]|nr:DUF2721 domain-containing protein [Stellaceae bacterium]